MIYDLGDVRFPEEKVRYEVATIRYVAANTTIPVPKIYHYGTAEDNPTGLGPFIIMEYVDHAMTLSHALNNPLNEPDERHSLDPHIGEEKLEFLYRQMANIVLQLSQLRFPQIGSLEVDESGQILPKGRPLIQNMNSIMEFTGIPSSFLPAKTLSSCQEWYTALADMHITQLTFQHNDAIEDEDDARDKYMARALFRRLASQGKLASEETSEEKDPYILYSEDLRPSNVLVDKDLRVVGVIDWEFTYAAPSQFSHEPPWWLLLTPPEDFEGGYKPWMEACEPRLHTFLRILAEEENKLGDSRQVPLSQRMRESWERRAWLITYAARKSWEFDFIYWKFLDEMFFGHNEDQDYHARTGLLTPHELGMMDRFVRMKMEETKERKDVTWDYESANALLAQMWPGQSKTTSNIG